MDSLFVFIVVVNLFNHLSSWRSMDIVEVEVVMAMELKVQVLTLFVTDAVVVILMLGYLEQQLRDRVMG